MAAAIKNDGPSVGIDLGTTYSCVAMWRNDRGEVIPNDQGNRLTPSCVAFTNSERLVGEAAENQAGLNPTNTVFDAAALPFLLPRRRRPPLPPPSLLSAWRPLVTTPSRANRSQRVALLPEILRHCTYSSLRAPPRLSLVHGPDDNLEREAAGRRRYAVGRTLAKTSMRALQAMAPVSLGHRSAASKGGSMDIAGSKAVLGPRRKPVGLARHGPFSALSTRYSGHA
ncbi:hypothetical protein EJB05_44859, partial [Eragrostis curvula]